MTDYNKTHAVEDMTRITKMVNTLTKMYEKREKMDQETREIVNGLYNTMHGIFEHETKKELQKQKKEGKEFISEIEIDNLFDKILKEEKYE